MLTEALDEVCVPIIRLRVHAHTFDVAGHVCNRYVQFVRCDFAIVLVYAKAHHGVAYAFGHGLVRICELEARVDCLRGKVSTMALLWNECSDFNMLQPSHLFIFFDLLLTGTFQVIKESYRFHVVQKCRILFLIERAPLCKQLVRIQRL